MSRTRGPGKVCQALGLPGASLGPREAGRSGGPPIPRGGGPGAGAALGRGQTNFLRLGSHRSPRTETPARGSAEPSPSPGPGATVITLKRQKHFLIFFFVCEVEISLLLLLCRFSRVRLCATPQTAAHQLPRPWDSPGKNTGVGCHYLLQWMKVKSESEVAQPCPTLSDPMDCSPPGSSVRGIFQARVLEWGLG